MKEARELQMTGSEMEILSGLRPYRLLRMAGWAGWLGQAVNTEEEYSVTNEFGGDTGRRVRIKGEAVLGTFERKEATVTCSKE